MNPTELRWNMTPIIVMVLGLLFALFLGVYIGGGEMLQLGIIFGVAALIAFVSMMRQHIWLLIPMFWGWTGSVSVLPIPFSVRDLIVMFVAGVSCALFALRVFKFKNQFNILDLLLGLNLFQVAVVFVTHPFGLKALQSDRVGARPYFNIAIATLAYFILSNQVISFRVARRLPILVVSTELVSSALFLLSRVSTSIGFALGRFYDGFLPPTYRSGFAPAFERLFGVARGGTWLLTALCAYFRPLVLIIPTRFSRFFLFLIGLTLVLISGFRSQLLTVAVIFVLAGYFHAGWKDVAISVAGFVVGACFLIAFNSVVHPLPISVQRTLSALPGEWDSRAAKDAQNSTEWRLAMWKDIPKGSQYINNKIMGDGFGFSRAELSAMERMKFLTGDISPEDFMLIGSFHSGPLSAVRFVGVVGLALYYALMIYSAVYAWRVVRRTTGLDLSPLALFVGLPLIWEPFNYTIVFGAYDAGLPETIFGVGMLKLIYNSLPKAVTKEPESTVLEPALSSRRMLPVR